ncbi:hypothetical protein GCM10025858_36430 [Alicyclobacillus sacchari]|nr:hypothetical protein GCM10025858_36430 [Alicyclobacillus sacchari]
MPKIVAITACPTGIAHTFMAQEALLQAGKKNNVEVRVETQGASGSEDTLTAAEIAAADAVIIAADKKVELDRFVGKRMLQTSVSAAIKEPETLLAQALDAPIYGDATQAYMDDIAAQKAAKNQGTPAVYRHLMNGVSSMLPLVIAAASTSHCPRPSTSMAKLRWRWRLTTLAAAPHSSCLYPFSPHLSHNRLAIAPHLHPVWSAGGSVHKA